MKICIVARQDIINPNDFNYHNDVGLMALDGIRFGKVKEVENEKEALSSFEDLKMNFISENSGWRADRYFIRFEDGHEIECIH